MKNSINLNVPALDLVAQSLGLEEVTTQRQRVNGSRSFVDPSTLGYNNQPVKYDVHPTGYVRRITGSSQFDRYQLNPKRRERLPTEPSRVLARSLNESIGILVRGVLNYRNF